MSEWELDHAILKAHSDGYEQGRADAIAEREEFWNMQNHKAYEQGRADAIRENLFKDCELCSLKLIQKTRADAIDDCINTIKKYWHFWNIGIIARVIEVLEDLKKN